MQIVQAIADADVLDALGQPAYVLRAGRKYVLYDQEAGFALRDGAVRLVASLDRVLAPYDREPLARHRLILLFIGRRGDAIVAASCVAAMKEKYPDVTVDVAGLSASREVFRLAPVFGELLPYPVEFDRFDTYDYYLSFEEVEAVPDGSRRSCGDVFSACLRTPRPTRPVRLLVPADLRARRVMRASSRPRVAVHVGQVGSLRTYPDELRRELIAGLVEAGFEVCLTGEAGPGGTDRGVAPEHVRDMIGQTPTPADLAAVLQQMDIVITGDSFPMHLAGALDVPTIAVFASTDSVLGSDYPSVESVRSSARCSPCRIAGGPCPLAHGECIAHRDESVSPGSLVKRIRSAVGLPVSL